MDFENLWNVYTVAFIAENAIFTNGNNDCLYPGHGFFQNRMRGIVWRNFIFHVELIIFDETPYTLRRIAVQIQIENALPFISIIILLLCVLEECSTAIV